MATNYKTLFPATTNPSPSRCGLLAPPPPHPAVRGGHLVLIRIQPYLDYGEQTLTKSFPARPGRSRWKPRSRSSRPRNLEEPDENTTTLRDWVLSHKRGPFHRQQRTQYQRIQTIQQNPLRFSVVNYQIPGFYLYRESIRLRSRPKFQSHKMRRRRGFLRSMMAFRR